MAKTAYEIEHERLRRENAESRKKVRAQLQEALRLAGFTPIVEQDDPEVWGLAVHVKAIHEDMTLYARANTHGLSGRVKFSVGYPEPKTGSTYQKDFPRPDITCALTKTPEQLAGDILRRVMPEFRLGMELARAANAKTEEYHARRDNELRAVLGRELEGREQKTGAARISSAADDSVWGDLRAHGDGTVTLDLHSVPVAAARAFLKMLGKA